MRGPIKSQEQRPTVYMLRDEDIYEELHPEFLFHGFILYPTFAHCFLAPTMDFLQSTSASSPSAPSSSAPTSVKPKPEDSLAQLAKDDMEQQPFTSSQGLQNSLDRRQQELQQDTIQNQYLIFASVPQKLSDRLCDNQTPTSKFCRFFFNPETGLLIAKLMARPAHELAVRSFDLLVYHELHAINVQGHLKPFGSTRVTIGNWTKQADCCWSPTSSTDAMPSFVVDGKLVPEHMASLQGHPVRQRIELHSSNYGE